MRSFAFEKLRLPVLIGAFLIGLAIRLPGFTDPPVEGHAVRQYRSALLARSLWVRLGADVEPWQRFVALASAPPILEPPVIEIVSAVAYRLVGGEILWFPRFLSLVAWLMGALGIYALARALASPNAALAGFIVMMTSPGGVIMSRSFQPESIVVAMSVGSLVAIMHWWSKPNGRTRFWALLVSSIAVVLKPTALFVVLPGAWCILRGREHSRRVAAVILGAVGAMTLWYLPVVFIGDGIARQFRVSFVPWVALESTTWTQAWSLMVDFVGLPWVIIGGGGIVIASIRRIKPRLPLVLCCAWGALVIVQPHHVATHDYYSQGMLLAFALGVGYFVDEVTTRLTLHFSSGARTAIGIGIVLIAGGYVVSTSSRPVSVTGLDEWLAMADRVGNVVEHSTKVCILGRAYGYPLRYHSWIAGPTWPPSVELAAARKRGEYPVDAVDRLNAFLPRPEWFVITDGRELDLQPDLQRFLLESGFPVVHSELGRVIVFDLRCPILPP